MWKKLLHLVRHARRIVTPYRPAAVVVYAGDNNLDARSGRRAEDVIADFRRFAEIVHAELPAARLSYVSIKPSPQRWERWPEMSRANAAIRQLCEADPRRRFIDIGPALLGGDGRPRGLRRAAAVGALVCGIAAAAGAAGLEVITSCEPVGKARPVCGFRNPEDLALLPDGHTLIVSEYGSSDGTRSGQLASFDLRQGERRVLYPGAGSASPDPRWGDPSCPGPPRGFSPHGIHVSEGPGGAVQLLVVQHADREAVEFFEVQPGAEGWSLVWRGCVPAPEDASLNDVVALPGPGFVVSKMYPRRGGAALLARGLAGGLGGRPTGAALEWLPGRGFAAIPGTALALPNGVEVSPDGSTLYVSSSLGHGLRVIDRRRGAVLAQVDLPGLDNSTWAPDGRLLVASILGGGDAALCQDLESGACPIEFQILAVEPESLAVEVLYRNRGAPMGAGTVGLQVGDELWIGSYASDRILRVDLSGAPAR